MLMRRIGPGGDVGEGEETGGGGCGRMRMIISPQAFPPELVEGKPRPVVLWPLQG